MSETRGTWAQGYDEGWADAHKKFNPENRDLWQKRNDLVQEVGDLRAKLTRLAEANAHLAQTVSAQGGENARLREEVARLLEDQQRSRDNETRLREERDRLLEDQGTMYEAELARLRKAVKGYPEAFEEHVCTTCVCRKWDHEGQVLPP